MKKSTRFAKIVGLHNNSSLTFTILVTYYIVIRLKSLVIIYNTTIIVFIRARLP